MHLKLSKFLIAFAFTCNIANAEILFKDSFESGDFSTSSAEVNSINLSYSYNRTGVVTQDGDKSTMVYPVLFTRSDTQNWAAKTGNYSLLFDHSAGVNMSEHRFSFDKPQIDIWLRYWIRVPTNYSHGIGGGGGPTNNKFLALWSDGYSQAGQGSTFWLSLENAGNGNSNLAFTNSIGYGNASQAMEQHTAFIDSANDRGRWMQMVIHLVAETSDGASDGVIQTWRRWENESDFTKLHDSNNRRLRIPPDGPNGFSAGYLMGWANGTYSESTFWLIDDFTIANTSLLTISSKSPAIPPPAFGAKENEVL